MKKIFPILIYMISMITIIGAVTYLDNTQGEFDSGTYSNTEWNASGFVQLSAGNTSGNFTSQVFGGNEATWNNISWVQGGYYQQELPSNQTTETKSEGVNMTSNLLLYHLNEISGNIIDYSGNGNSGTESGGVTYSVSGKFNKGISFDGSNDRIIRDTLVLGSSATFEVWAKANSFLPYPMLFNHPSDASATYYDVIFYNNVISLNTGDGANNPFKYPNGTNIPISAVSLNVWHHYVIINDAVENKALFYLDGAYFGYATYKNPTSTSTRTLGLGGVSPYLWNGTMDEFAVYNRAISATEVLDRYKRGALKLNLSIRGCNDALCDGESWTNLGGNLNSPQTFSYPTNSYFQYKFYFTTDNSNYTPKLYNVTVDYTLLDTLAPTVDLNAPSDGLNSSSQTIDFNFTATEDYEGDINCSIYLDGGLNQSNSSTLNNTLTNFEISGISNQAHNWSIICLDSASNTNTSVTRSFYVDLTPPTISNIFYSPNETDNVDPGTNLTFNVAVSDDRMGVDTVILQYHNGTGWTNATMTNISLTSYNITITTVSTNANYTYSVWANDSFGNSNQSANQTFDSVWDCTWSVTSDLGQVAGWDGNKFVGDITLNNTGDVLYYNNNCSLGFRLSYDLSEGRIYFDSSYLKPSDTYILSAGSVFNVSVNATFLTEVKQENVVITSSESYGRSSTSSANTTAIIVSNQAGPYLYQEVTSNPSSIYLTKGNFSLNGYLRNLMGSATVNENNTAYNVTFNWTLPSGLINVSGNGFVSYENITSSILNYNSINVSFSDLASMDSGVQTIYLYSQGYNLSGDLIVDANNNSILTDFFNISFLCYETSDGVVVADCGSLDGDYVAPTTVAPATSSGGGGGGGGGGEGQFNEFSDAYFELLRGGVQEFILPIENKLSSPKRNINVEVTGVSSKYLSFSPEIIPYIGAYSSENLTIKINAPAYFSKGEYNLIFTLSGEIVGNTTSNFRESKSVKLFIVEVLRSDADEMLSSVREKIDEMNSSGFILKDVSILFEKILENYNQTNFLGVQENYLLLEEIYDAAFESLKILKELSEGIAKSEKNGVTTIETKKVLYIAQAIFKRGDYLQALEKLESAKLMYALETKGEINLFYTIKNNPYQSLIALFGFSIFSLMSSLAVKSQIYKRKLKLLKEEEVLLLELMKVVQRDCFEGNKMSMEEYGDAMSQYEAKLSEAIEERIRVETKLANIYKVKGKKLALTEEKKRLLNLVMDVQDRYLNKANIETRIYENMVKSYSTKLAEVESELTVIETEEALRGGGFFKKLFKKEKKEELQLKIKKVKWKSNYDKE